MNRLRRILLVCLTASLLLAGRAHAEEMLSFCVIGQDTVALGKTLTADEAVSRYLLELGDQGYPFVEIVLDRYLRSEDREYIHYRIVRGDFVEIDTVVFGDYSAREISLLSRYITLPGSGAFHYSRVRSMIDELKTNPLLKVEDRADIYRNGIRFYTEARQDIRFDAVVAYKQEAEQKGIVGDISCELINLAGLGRLASFYWSRPSLGVNSIDISYTEPYILNKPFSAQISFAQRYQDSLYVKRDLDLGLVYHINRRADFMITYSNEQISTTSIGSDSGFVTQSRSGTVLSLNWVSLPGPVSGYLSGSSGFFFSEQSRVSRSEMNALLAYRRSRFGVNLHLLGGIVASDGPVALYDRFKLGGAAFLRGAYFEQFITDRFFGWKLETGYFYRNHLFLFYDGAFLGHPSLFTHHAGIGFSLPAGNNRLTLGVGADLAGNIQQAKFHLSWNMGEK